MTESSQRGDYERRIKRLEDNDEKSSTLWNR